MSELARRVGMSRDGLYKALSAEGNPTWTSHTLEVDVFQLNRGSRLRSRSRLVTVSLLRRFGRRGDVTIR